MPEVRVSQKDGPITLNAAGDETTWHVTDHTTNVADDKLELFLANVEGSTIVTSKPDESQKASK